MVALFPDITTVLGALLVLAMTSIFFCCFKRTNSIDGKSGVYSVKEKSPSPEAIDTNDVTRCDVVVTAPDQSEGAPVEDRKSTEGIGDFSDVQRETEILRSYRRPQAPRKKERHSRAPRVLTRSTERLLDVYGGPIEQKKDNTDGTINANGKGPIHDLQDNGTGAVQKEGDESGEVKMRDGAGQDRDKRETRSSMLLDIEQTLASLYQQQHVGKANGQQEGNKPEGQLLMPVESGGCDVTEALSSGLEVVDVEKETPVSEPDGSEETTNVVSAESTDMTTIQVNSIKEKAAFETKQNGIEESFGSDVPTSQKRETEDSCEEIDVVNFDDGQAESGEYKDTTKTHGMSDMTESCTSSTSSEDGKAVTEPKLNASTEMIGSVQEQTSEVSLTNKEPNVDSLKTVDAGVQNMTVLAPPHTHTTLVESEIGSKPKKIPPKVSPKPSPKLRAKIEAAAKEAKSEVNAESIESALKQAITSQEISAFSTSSPEMSASASQRMDSSPNDNLTPDDRCDVHTITTESQLKQSSTDDMHINSSSSTLVSTKNIPSMSLNTKQISGIPLPKSPLTEIRQNTKELSLSSGEDMDELTNINKKDTDELNPLNEMKGPKSHVDINSDLSTITSERKLQITDVISDPEVDTQQGQEQLTALESNQVCSGDETPPKQYECFDAEETTASPTSPKSKIPLSPLLADKVAKKAKAESAQDTTERTGRQRKESEENRGKTSKIPVRAGSKSRSSPPKSSNENTTDGPEEMK